jgi:hypothetical protein
VATEPDLISQRDFDWEFKREFRDGHHFTAIGPTGRGKSKRTYRCLALVTSPDRQAISLHGKIKGRDPVIPVAAKAGHLRVVSELPSAVRQRYDRKRGYHGYLLVPLTRPGKSAAEENAILQAAYRPAIHGNYSQTKRKTITHVNEAHQTQVDLKLKEACEAVLMRGAPDNTMFSETQRGRFLSYHTYGAPEWMLIYYDDDRDNRKRYADFGCADPDEIEYLTGKLQTAESKDGRTISQCLVLRRRGDMFIVDT